MDAFTGTGMDPGGFHVGGNVPGTAGYEWLIAENRVKWSDGAADILGVARPDLDNARLMDFVHPAERETVSAHLRRILHSGTRYSHGFRICQPDGAVRKLMDRGEIIRAATGKATALRGIIIDVTGDAAVDTTDDAAPGNARPILPAPRPSQKLSELMGRVSGLGAYELNLETGSAIWSKELLRILGRPDAEVSGSVEMALQLVHPQDRDRVRAEMASALSRTGHYDFEYRLQIGSGEVRWVRDRGEVYGAGSSGEEAPKQVVGILVDITQRKLAEDSVASSDAVLEALFQNSPVGMAVWDRSFRYVRVNEKLAQINGMPAEDHIGKTPKEVLPDLDEVEALYAGWRRIIQTGKPWLNVEVSGKTPANPDSLRLWRVHFFPVVTHGEITGIAATAEDVTAQRHAEDVLRDSALQLQRILDGTVGFVGVLDADGTTTEANAPALNAANLDREDVIGLKFWDAPWWSHDTDIRNRVKTDIERAADGTHARYDVDVWLGEGKTITIDFQLYPIKDDTGRVTHIIPSGFDVTERNEAMEHLQMIMAEVNHRSKNMLSLVQAVARQTVRTSPDDFLDKFSARISAIAKAQDLLVQANWASVDLRTLVESQLDYFKDAIDDRIHVSGPPIVISAQAAQSLSLVLHELATNAGKYGSLSNAEGRVTISWTVEESDGPPLLSLDWVESGGPKVSPPTRTGFGSVLISTMIESAFDARSEISYDPSGIKWRLIRGSTGIG